MKKNLFTSADKERRHFNDKWYVSKENCKYDASNKKGNSNDKSVSVTLLAHPVQYYRVSCKNT